MTAAEAVQAGGRFLHVTFDDAFKNVQNALPALERLSIPSTLFACADYAADGRPLRCRGSSAEAAAHPEQLATMTWDELRALAERGVEIGSHTLTHPHLTALSDGELLPRAPRVARALRGRARPPVPYIAYP